MRKRTRSRLLTWECYFRSSVINFSIQFKLYKKRVMGEGGGERKEPANPENTLGAESATAKKQWGDKHADGRLVLPKGGESTTAQD